ncbi:acetyl-CoA carboxylase biotin carboxylase subunit family protein [Kitasatospora sp. DSM 101779]|uniref:ATP-grasp domain-containing protein n=1 Tax=Kitasatospora sp. DSM 101779 TaxID=2853165 RepID=UPI0021D8879E|nr:ATP-grasp domain-containing protein [Kitasatospora sp. DSM 101779]MCU7822169.1 ATP-grasp domain-containing protein [Kitasatospora sp. DSM 101779]
MKILIMNQVPYRKIQYHLGIDHEKHDVTYVCGPIGNAQLPEGLRCERLLIDPALDLTEQVIARTSRADGYEQVLALSESGILGAHRIREHLGVPGPSLEQLEKVRDKVAMKRALLESGVRHPRFVAAPPVCGPLPWTGKTVVKPRQGASSEGVSVHDTAREAVEHYRTLAEPGDYQLEEYIEGELFHADALVAAGRLSDLVVSRYAGKPVDFAAGLPIGSGQLPYEERYHRFAAQAVTALGIEEGCLHLEFFETAEGELVFLEVANRLGGGGIVDSHLRHTGVHLPSHEIAIRLGFDRPEPQRPSGRYHGFLIFPGHHLEPGARMAVDIPDELREHPCVDRMHLLEQDGAAAPGSGSVTYQEWEVPLFVEASHQDAAVLREFLERCLREITVEQRVLAGAAA